MLGQNLLEAQQMLKRLGDSDLATVAQQPSPMQFLAAAELSEREQMRAAYLKSANKAGKQSVAERLVQGATNQSVAGNIAAANQGGLAAAQAPQGYAEGGLIRGYNEGGPIRRQAPVTVTGRRPEEMEFPFYDAMRERMAQNADDIAGLFTEADKRVRANFANMPDRISPRLAQVEAQAARDAEALRRDKWMALAQAGLAAAAGQSPNFLSNVAAGANVGLGSLGRAFEQGATRDTARTARTDALENARMAQEAQQVAALNQILASGTTSQASALADAARGAAQFETSERAGQRSIDINNADNAAAMARERMSQAGADRRTAAELGFRREEALLKSEDARNDYIDNLLTDALEARTIDAAQAEALRRAYRVSSLGPSTAQSIQDPVGGGLAGAVTAPAEAMDARRYGLTARRAEQIKNFLRNGGDPMTLPEAEQVYARALLARAEAGTGRQ